MKLNTLCLAALFAFSAITTSPAKGQVSAVPQTLNFQGRLANPSGNPVPNGTYSIRFSLWSALSGGTEKWNQTIATVQVRNGTFAVPLNVSTGAADKFNSNLWLEIKVGADAPLTPRQPLVTAPYAFKADVVKDGAITTASIANGAVTNAKITSVDWSKITGAPTSSLMLPFAATQNSPAPDILFYISNTGSGDAIRAEAVAGTAIYGKSGNIGVFGGSQNAAGVYGSSVSASGVFGISTNSYGVYGYGQASHGVYGSSISGSGGYFTTSGTNGVYAESIATGGNGIYAVCNNGTSAYGVLGVSSTGYGVVGSGSRYGVYSSGPAGGSTGWANLSDVRYKQNIVPFENALEAILNLRGVSYEYRRDEFKSMNFPKGTQIGFIAQEIEKSLPEVVLTDENGYKSVTYANVVPVLVEAVKTLNARSVIQQKQNNALQAENAELRARLERIEAALEIRK